MASGAKYKSLVTLVRAFHGCLRFVFLKVFGCHYEAQCLASPTTLSFQRAGIAQSV
jgi:hypothetical protein